MKTFIILGMHRSATSLVAGGVQSMGVHIGEDLLGPAKGNPKGFYENRVFVRLNREILKAAGGMWSSPPSREDILATRDQFDSRIRDTVDVSKKELWGFKDPRMVLTIELFLPYLERPHFIACFRDPMEVAMSLKVRNGFELERGLALANEYNKRLIDFLSRRYTV